MTNCPAHSTTLTTETITIGTTVCPVDSTITPAPTSVGTIGTITRSNPPKATSSSLPVTAGAGRVAGVEVVAAAAGLLAALL